MPEKVAVMLVEDITIIIISLMLGLPFLEIALILFSLFLLCCACSRK